MVACLWDVTDKEADTFTKALLTSAMGVRSFSKHRAEGKDSGSGKHARSEQELEALERAAMRSRESCMYRYLSGAGFVVYGVPLAFTERDDDLEL